MCLKINQSNISLSTSKKNWYYNNLRVIFAQKMAFIDEGIHWNNRSIDYLLSKYRLININSIFNIFLNNIEILFNKYAKLDYKSTLHIT